MLFKKDAKISAILSLLITGGFLLAFIMKDDYGGAMKHVNGIEKTLLGINIGVLGSGMAFILLLATTKTQINLKSML